MGKAVRSNLTRAIPIFLALTGCARDAPDLPPISSVIVSPARVEASANQEIQCNQLFQERADIRLEMKQIEIGITASRQSDQTAGYFAGILFPPAALGIDQKEFQKAQLDERQAKLDRISMERRLLACPSQSGSERTLE